MKNYFFKKLLVILFLFFGFIQPNIAEIVKIEVIGPIDPIKEEFINGGIQYAEGVKAEFILIRLNTPGGLGISMQNIVQTILNSTIPVVCYVSPFGSHAASAGFFILLASDVAVMAPGTNTGAAHPVFPFGIENKTMLEKIRNDALANLRSIVENRKRDFGLAEKGVTESLSFTEKEAKDGSLIDLIAEDDQHLFKQLEGLSIKRFNGEIKTLSVEGQLITLIKMTNRQRFLSAMADPNLSLFLVVLAFIGLYIELQAPGLIFPGVIGTICLILSLLGFSLLPISYIGVLLVLLGAGLFMGEFLFHGSGILGITGGISFILGLLFLIDSPYPDMRISWVMAIALGLPIISISMLFLWATFKGIVTPVGTGSDAFVGRLANVRDVSGEKTCRVQINGELWNALSTAPIKKGETVRIENVDSLTLIVKPKN